MESLDNKIKRKIRRTRGSLNEIRRRANTKPFTRGTAPIILTTNRLTLNKAVRSETVTRASIPKRKFKSSTSVSVNDSEKDVDLDLALLQDQSENIDFDNKSNLIKDKNNLCPIIPRILSTKNWNWDIDDSNIEVFSPSQTDSPRSCISSESLQTNDDCHTYEQFMKSISNQIRKVALPITDNIDKGMNTLKNMYLDELTHPNDNTLQCDYSSSSGKTIVQSLDCMSRDQTSPGVSSLSPHSSSHLPNYPLISVICDSPEYHFYPHKLNQ